MPPRFLVNKHTKVLFPYSPILATNTDLEPFYGDEPAQERAEAADEVTGSPPGEQEQVDEVVDPVTGAILDDATTAPNKKWKGK